jgi:hypothetical protein
MLKRSTAYWLIAACLLAVPASAGLRALYGGDLVLTAPTAPTTLAPAQAWSASEVALVSALSGRLANVVDGPPAVTGNTVRWPLRGDLTWFDGSTLDGRSVVSALKSANANAVVALPPMNIRLEGRELVIDFPANVSDPARFFELPWLRLTKSGDGGPFRQRKSNIEANPNGLGGRAFADRIRVDVKETRKLEAVPEGLALLQPGVDGRAVFALPRVNGRAQKALVSALAGVDRAALARLFVRTASRVPDDWPSQPSAPAAPVDSPITLLIDAAERDHKAVADRLQVLLRDQKIQSRIVAEERGSFLTHLSRGDYDLALVAIPPAPKPLQAATLVRFAKGKASADELWKTALNVANPKDEEELLRSTATSLGATLLYFEAGGVARGSRVRGISPTAAWDIDFGNAWLAPAGMVP